jgi:hypothetical protein
VGSGFASRSPLGSGFLELDTRESVVGAHAAHRLLPKPTTRKGASPVTGCYLYQTQPGIIIPFPPLAQPSCFFLAIANPRSYST